MTIDTLLRRANVRGYELRRGIETFTHQLTAALSVSPVTVEWSRSIATAGINQGGMMLLSDVADDLIVSRATVARYAGFVFHELLHRKWTDFSARDWTTYVDAMHNAVEDAWIENRAITTALVPNAGPLLSDLLRVMVGEATGVDWADPRQYPFVFAVHLRDHAPVRMPLAVGLEPIMLEARQRLNTCNSSHDTLDLARWIVQQLHALPPEDQTGDQSGDQTGDQSGDQSGDQAGDQSGDQSGDGHANGTKQAQDAGSEDGEGIDPSDSNDAPVGSARRPTIAEMADAVDPEPTLGEQPCAGGSFSKQSALTQPGFFDTGEVVINAPPFSAPAAMRREIRRMFENTDTSGFDSNRRSGSLNISQIARSATGSDRLFQRRVEHEGVDSAVLILLDLSSSMDGRRIEASVQACDALIDTLKSANAAVSVVGFSGWASVISDWNEPAARVKAKLRRLNVSGGTNDWYALRIAHEMLLARRETRKVCFVLTDGDGDIRQVRQQCASGANLGITTIGIGIGRGNSVDTVYAPNGIKVLDLSGLASVALSRLKLAA